MASQEQVDRYATLLPLLKAMLRDFQELAKKKPDGALNAKKVLLVNRLLTDLRQLLGDEPSAPYLDLLDQDELPQNSDVLLILGQFDAAMASFRSNHTEYNDLTLSNDWQIDDE